MPLEVRDSRDNHLIHRNEHVAPDFDVPELVEQTGEREFPGGRGTLRHWYFDGIRLGHARWQFQEPCTQQWRSELDVVHLQFNLRGRLSIEHRQLGRVLTLGAYQHNLMYSPGFEGTHRYDDREAETFMVQFTRPVFLRLAAQADEGLRRFGEQMLAGRPLLLGERSLALSLPLHQAIREVLSCRLPAPLKKLYLHAKALEILVLQAEAFAQQRPQRHVRTEYDQERLLFARDYLIQHLHLPPSLPELARIAGLNEFKLKNGFKELFGQPVFAYLAEYRLLEARAQLIEGGKTASELAFELGYSSLQHLSAAFKKRFGVSPRELR
ncbi:helix-turn-helix transcriptional regulator [Hymenobacter jeollabukensis]|uniref:Helix-turn-helix transcriptional regulator n=1 Tax=Hymenobacter jeollabukensis TaxID=2025313 RepID=A0A5R8WNH4_9BACT|nr:AraC family transcriptional regulator [Hymenobacter jeollabukensis]TLM91186.1 helix-turn-helix transcriptional regulator [Hymenobacter jeollabukensis]